MSLTELDIKRGRKQLQMFEQIKAKNKDVRTKRKVIKQGNSYMVSIPSKILEELNLSRNDIVNIELVNGQIVITPDDNLFYKLINED